MACLFVLMVDKITHPVTSRRTKVLFLIPTLEGGGAERVFSMLLAHLDRTRFEPHLAVLQIAGAYRQDIPEDVVMHDLKVPRVRYALPSIVRLVWKVRPQTILSTLGHLNLALILCKPLLPRATKLVVREAAVVSAVLPEETQHPKLWRWLYRRLYRRADTVVCLCDSMVKDMAEHFNVPRGKLVRIYNPVDVKRLQDLADSGDNPYTGAGPHLVAAGRLTRQKGFDVLVAAMPKVLMHYSTAQLLLLGEGPLRGDLIEQIEKLSLTDAVHLLGFQRNPWPYLKYADLFVLSSRYEGLPNILLEALALGKRVVATDCPGAIREIQNCGEGMVLVPPDDPVTLAEAINSFCSRLIPSGKITETSKLALGKFDLQYAVGEYSRLLLS